MKTRLYLDARKPATDGRCPLKLGICRNRETAYIPLGLSLLPEQWSAGERQLSRAKFPNRASIQNYIDRRQSEIESVLLQLEASGALHLLSARECRDKVLQTLSPAAPATLADCLRSVISSHDNQRTREIYQTTLNRLLTLCPDAERLTLEQVTPLWLQDFTERLRSAGAVRQNARCIHLRNIRAAMNWAIDNELTDNYPFRKFRLKQAETPKRSLSLCQLQELAAMPLQEKAAEYRDIFLLSFCLIGINLQDLALLTADSVQSGRIEYDRLKTHRHYSVKIEPEAQALIDEYAGSQHLVSIADRYRKPHDYLKHINAGLQRLMPELTTYWARHTWATLAYNELRIPTDTISLALGHANGSRVTAVYINPDLRLVDEANRRVLDLVFGKK